MDALIKVLVVLGTRPEAIKLAPVIRELQNRETITTRVLFSGQHEDLVRPILRFFNVRIDAALDLMTHNQGLAQLTARALVSLDQQISAARPDWLIVQGDTTTAMAATVAAFYNKINVAHVEAGLRSRDLFAPFPEEVNRRFISQLAALNWAPTHEAADNLRNEGLPVGRGRIVVTGNTGIDAAMLGRERLKSYEPDDAAVARVKTFRSQHTTGVVILVTSHRRENVGTGIGNVCQCIAEAAARHDNVLFVFPVHPRRDVRTPVQAALGSRPNVLLTEPKDYPILLWMLENCDGIITDSGGIQEEATVFGKRVLVTRDVTERPEAVATGHLELVGTDAVRLNAALTRLISDSIVGRAAVPVAFPYGDGKAAARCVGSLVGQPIAEFTGTSPSVG